LTEKFRVAVVYNKNYEALSGNFFANAYYHFFITVFKRNEHLEAKYFAVEKSLDIKKIQNEIDVILLPGFTGELVGIEDTDIPVIYRAGDCHDITKSFANQTHKKYKVDYYFGYMPESYFHQFYPKHFKFKTIVYGLEPSLYQNLKPFSSRIKNRILNSGVVGNPKFYARFINVIRNPSSNTYKHYKLRTICNKLPYVDYTSPLDHQYVNDRYPTLLSKYVAAIAATTYFPTIKYWEIPAAGCLTFMEITDKNKGGYLGFVDGKSAIFIDENNYKEKFEEYLSDVNDPKWEQIANEGRTHALTNLNNDKAVELLVDLIRDLV